MIEDWIVFKDKATGKELLAYTVRGTFAGEMQATIELLAAENGIPAEQIAVTRESRRSTK